MLVALYLDADSCGARFVAALRRLGFDCALGTMEVPDAAPDEAQLTRAVAMGRLLVTANAQDFAALYSSWASAGKEHFGIIVCVQRRRRSPEALAEAVFAALAERSGDDLRNSIQRA